MPSAYKLFKLVSALHSLGNVPVRLFLKNDLRRRHQQRS